MDNPEQRAKGAIQAVFRDTRVAPEATLDILKGLIEELNILIESLESDMGGRDGRR